MGDAVVRFRLMAFVLRRRRRRSLSHYRLAASSSPQFICSNSGWIFIKRFNWIAHLIARFSTTDQQFIGVELSDVLWCSYDWWAAASADWKFSFLLQESIPFSITRPTYSVTLVCRPTRPNTPPSVTSNEYSVLISASLCHTANQCFIAMW